MSNPQKVEVVRLPDWKGIAMYQLKVLRSTRENADGIEVKLPQQEEQWWGDCIHTTGSGVESHAVEFTKKTGHPWTLAEVAAYFYSNPGMGCPHEFIAHDGSITRVTPETLIPAHCGVQPYQRTAMLKGTWDDMCPAEMVRQFRMAWPTFASPQHLFPGPNANWKYRGTELIPTKDKLFTPQQYDSLAVRLAWSSKTYEIDHLGGKGNRLVGHEDLNPWPTAQRGRADAKGGWDPGARRVVPRFNWTRVREALAYQLATWL